MVSSTILFIVIISVLETQWISPTTPLIPQPDRRKEMVAGYHENIITLIGGVSSSVVNYDIIQYNISNDSFTLFSNALPTDVFTLAQGWTQMGTVIYMPQYKRINQYDLSTKQFTTNWNNIEIPTNVEYLACIASSDQMLYIVGGADAIDLLQIYDITSNVWTQGPNMNVPRVEHGCVVSSKTNTLYAIAGSPKIGDDPHNTVEYISLSSLDSWKYTNNNLNRLFVGGMAVEYDIYVYIIGGFTSYDDGTSYVQIINVLTNIIIDSSDNLVYWVHYTAPIVIGQRLYAFGRGYSPYGDRFQYYDLPQPEPTTTASTTDKPTTAAPTTDKPTTIAPAAISTTAVSETSVVSTTNEQTTVVLSTDTQITNTKPLTTDSETEYVSEQGEVLRMHSSLSTNNPTQISFDKTDSDVDQDVFQENVDIDWLLIGECGIILIVCCGICVTVYVFYVQLVKSKRDIQHVISVNDDNDKKKPKLANGNDIFVERKDENIEKEMDINIEMDVSEDESESESASGLFGIHPSVTTKSAEEVEEVIGTTVQGAPSHQMNTKCSECGILSEERVDEGQVFVCTTCKALDDITVNRKVSDMFRSNNMPCVTPNVTMDENRTTYD